MPVEFYAIAIPFCAIPVFLVSVVELNKHEEVERRKNNVIDFDKFVKHKEAGDVVDSDIAELLDIEQVAA